MIKDKEQKLHSLTKLLSEVTEAISILSTYDTFPDDDKMTLTVLYNCARADTLLHAMDMIRLEKSLNLEE